MISLIAVAALIAMLDLEPCKSIKTRTIYSGSKATPTCNCPEMIPGLDGEFCPVHRTWYEDEFIREEIRLRRQGMTGDLTSMVEENAKKQATKTKKKKKA